MSTRELNAFCPRKCKGKVYSAEYVDQKLQELETGNLKTLLWYKGEDETCKYEYSGVDPRSVVLYNYGNLLLAILSGGIGLEEEDMNIILNLPKFYVKAWYNTAEYYANIDDGRLNINKVNYYSWSIDSRAESAGQDFYNGMANLKLSDKNQNKRLDNLEKYAITKKTTLFNNTAGVQIGTIEDTVKISLMTVAKQFTNGTEFELHLSIPESNIAGVTVIYPLVVKMTYNGETLSAVESNISASRQFNGSKKTPLSTYQINDVGTDYYEIFPNMLLTKNSAGTYDLVMKKANVYRYTTTTDQTVKILKVSKDIVLTKIVKVEYGI